MKLIKFIRDLIIGWKEFSRLKKQKEHNEIQRQKYLVAQHNQIVRKKCKLSRFQKNKIEAEICELIKTGKLEIIL